MAAMLGGQLDDALGSSDSSSSRAEHIMPFDTTPRTGFFSSVIFDAGNVGAERREHADQAGARVGGAAHHLDQRRLPVSTWQTCSLSALGCLPASTMRATVKAASFVGRIVDALDLEADRRQLGELDRRRSRGDP